MLLLSGAEWARIALDPKKIPAICQQAGPHGHGQEDTSSPARPNKGFVPFQVRVVGLDHEEHCPPFAHALYQLGANH